MRAISRKIHLMLVGRFAHDCPSVAGLDWVKSRDHVANVSAGISTLLISRVKACAPHHGSWRDSFRNQAVPLFLAQNLKSCVELVKETVLALHLLDTMLVEVRQFFCSLHIIHVFDMALCEDQIDFLQ